MTTNFNYTEAYDHTFVVADGRKVAIQNEGNGVALFVEGFEAPVVYIDFYYMNDGREGYHRAPAPHITIYDTAAPNGDPVGYILLEPDGTRVAFERGVKIVEHDNKQYGELWGYEI